MSKKVQVLFMFVLRLCLVRTHRPQQVISLALEDGFLAEETEEAEHAQPDEATAVAPQAAGSFPGSQKVFTVGPGVVGIDIASGSGKILRVYKGTDADRLGWKVGQQITQVENQKYTFRLYAQISEASSRESKLYKITIDTAAHETVGAVEWLAWYAALPAGITGATLVLACPWFIYQIFRSGLDGGGNLNQRVMWLLFVVAAGNGIGRMCLQLSSVTSAGLFYGYGVATYSGGVLLGYFWNLRSPLLDIVLRQDVARQVQRADAFILVLYFALNGCVVGKAVSFFILSKQTNIVAAIGETFFFLRYIPLYFVQIEFYWMVSRICAAARQSMLEVAETLPCDAAKFEHNVHETSAKLLKEFPPQLVTCGWPLVLLTLSIPGLVIWFYDDLMTMIFRKNAVLKNWTLWVPWFFDLGWWIIIMALTGCAVAVGPFWLSSGLKALKAKLNETRRRDPTMHLQVQAIYVMLAKARKL